MTTSDAQLALYERIVETASEGVLVIDAASRTRFANPSMARMLGYDRAELVGRSLVELVDEPARQIVVTSLERWRAIVRGTEHVLVVEDDATVSRMVVRALEAVGYRVHAERSPMVGLAWARAQQGRFHILVTDVVMPGMSGQQLAEQLTAEFPAVRVLYISGYTENTIVHRGVLDEGIDFLAKPFAPSELQLRVRAILDRS